MAIGFVPYFGLQLSASVGRRMHEDFLNDPWGMLGAKPEASGAPAAEAEDPQDAMSVASTGEKKAA